MVGNFKVTLIVGVGLSLQEIADSFLTIFQASWTGLIDATSFISGVQAELLVAATGKVIQSAQAVDNVTGGTGGGGAVPSQVAAVVRKITGFAGRKHRGRIFAPFLAFSFLQANGELTAGSVASFTAATQNVFGNQNMLMGLRETDLQATLQHKGAPITTDDVVDFQCTGKLGTQRRRGDYGRTNSPLA
jgi:hypothetical protein